MAEMMMMMRRGNSHKISVWARIGQTSLLHPQKLIHYWADFYNWKHCSCVIWGYHAVLKLCQTSSLLVSHNPIWKVWDPAKQEETNWKWNNREILIKLIWDEANINFIHQLSFSRLKKMLLIFSMTNKKLLVLYAFVLVIISVTGVTVFMGLADI